MTIFNKTVTLANGETKELHRTVAKRFSVEILEGGELVTMQRVIFGVVGSAFTDDDFLFVRLLESIPTGAIFAAPKFAGGATIRVKIRTGADFTGVPESTQAFAAAAVGR